MLKGLTLNEKLAKLNEWLEKGKDNEGIDYRQYNYFTNLWLNREAKKKLKDFGVKPKRKHCKTILEREVMTFTDGLKGSIDFYLTYRRTFPLSEEVLMKFSSLLEKAGYLEEVIDELLIVALRHPDKRLNKLAYQYIVDHRKGPIFADEDFFTRIWLDGNIVPLDVVRLMVRENNEIDPAFSRLFISKLIPLITIQRDKEITRLEWAKSLTGEKHKNEVERKTKRLEAFEKLLETANIYVYGR